MDSKNCSKTVFGLQGNQSCKYIIWTLLCTLFFPAFISDETLGFSNSVFSICFFAAVFMILWKEGKLPKDKRLNIYTHLLGFLFSFMISAGHSLDVYGEISFRNLLISIIPFTHLIAKVLSLFWRLLIDTERKLKTDKLKGRVSVTIERIMALLIKRPYMIAVLLLMCWLPCFIADFPGGFRYDAGSELDQAVHGYNGDFPLLHSVIITRLLPFVYNITKSYNKGVAIYVIIQMIMVACMYMHIIYAFGKKSINKIVLFIALLYCGCFPVIQLLVVQEVRDVLFSALLMYVMFLFYLMESDKAAFFKGVGKPILLGIVFVLALLARSNNAETVMLIAVIAVSIIVWVANRKKFFRGATILLVTSIGSFLLLGVLLTSLCQPLTPAKTGSSLSIMSQSIARAYLYENEKWTDEEIAELSMYIDLQDLLYCAEEADRTKNRMNIENNFSDFLKFWCKTGLKYPRCYINAILAHTQNMWYPDSVIDGYNQIDKVEGGRYIYFEKCYYWITSQLEWPAVHRDLWPSVLNYYTQIGLYISFEKIPIVSMFFSIGFQFWIILNCLFYVMYRKLNKLILPLVIILGYMLISACVPLVILRYFAAAFLAVPMLIVFTLQPDH